MMPIFYNILIHIYHFLIRVSSLFNAKAKQWVEGRKSIFERMSLEVKTDRPLAWFHCASLGEFEQGRPLIEAFKTELPQYRILLTFFSPSGFEVRKNYDGADYIYYLPADTIGNAKKFLQITRPKIAVFVKYEYWFNYIGQLKKMNIPIIGVSSIFRPGQRFFTWYGGWQLSLLRSFNHFFVQNETSAQLLKNAGINQVTVSGDTRFDRVFEIAGKALPFPLIKGFKGDSMTFIAGSTWPPDEELVLELIGKNFEGLRFIIAPHEVHKDRVDALMKKLPGNSLRFSEITQSNIHNTDVIVVDNIGILSHLYQYADISFIGGGFGVGIHNILEAATFGQPVIFGPNYQKFQEARELFEDKGAFPVKTKSEFLEITTKLLNDHDFRIQCSQASREYVRSNKGATKMIVDYIQKNII